MHFFFKSLFRQPDSVWYYHSVMLLQRSLSPCYFVSSVKEQQQAPATKMDVLCHHFSCQMMACLTSPLLSSPRLLSLPIPSSPPSPVPSFLSLCTWLLYTSAVHISSLLVSHLFLNPLNSVSHSSPSSSSSPLCSSSSSLILLFSAPLLSSLSGFT